MTYLVERLVELRRHLDHLRDLRPRVTSAEALRRDLSLHNDVLFSLVMVCQLVIDLAGEPSARRGLRFGDYTEAVRNLGAAADLDDDLVRRLETLPGFRNVVLQEYATLDLERAVEALDRLNAVEELLEAVRRQQETGDLTDHQPPG